MPRKFNRSDGHTEDELAHAAADALISAKVLFGHNHRTLDHTGYLSHLGLELMLKSILLHEKGEFPAHHDLEALIAELEAQGVHLCFNSQDHDLLKRLNRFAALRYPDPAGMPSIRQADWETVLHLRRRLLKQMSPELERHYWALDDTKKGGRKLQSGGASVMREAPSGVSGSQSQLDIDLLRGSPITLYWRRSVLETDSAELRNLAYRVIEFDAATWLLEEDFHRSIALELGFPGYYGANLDAFNDCLGDVSAKGGLAVVFWGFDAFHARCPDTAQSILDIFAGVSRTHLLFGQRLLVLVQSNNPRIEFGQVGAQPVVWNRREWLNADRQ